MKVELEVEEATNRLGADILTQMMLYGQRKNLGNPIQWFCLRLKYKAANLLYRRLKNGDIGEMKVRDIYTICAIIKGIPDDKIDTYVDFEMQKLSRELINV